MDTDKHGLGVTKESMEGVLAIHVFMRRTHKSCAVRINPDGSMHESSHTCMNFMLVALALCSVSIFTLGEHKYERITSNQHIKRPLVLTYLF